MCGLVMPIAAMDGYEETHWVNVQSILREAINDAGFEAEMVSTSADVGVIQARIVQNLYDNPIVVCDVSGKNPNVMFELGMRLAFDKPIIIVKDDTTGYSFDTSPIEHLTYRRDLRYQNILEFKEKLSARISGTHAKASDDQSYSPFLKHFGKFEIAKLETKEVNSYDYLISRIDNLQGDVRHLSNLYAKALIETRRLSELDILMDNLILHHYTNMGGNTHPLNMEEELIHMAALGASKHNKNLAPDVVKSAAKRALDRFIESDIFNDTIRSNLRNRKDS